MNNNPICEDAPCCGCCGQDTLAGEHLMDELQETGWPGDGSGMDDLADYNANEADDYSNEGDSAYYESAEDAGLDASWEDRFECDCGE